MRPTTWSENDSESRTSVGSGTIVGVDIDNDSATSSTDDVSVVDITSLMTVSLTTLDRLLNAEDDVAIVELLTSSDDDDEDNDDAIIRIDCEIDIGSTNTGDSVGGGSTSASPLALYRMRVTTK